MKDALLIPPSPAIPRVPRAPSERTTMGTPRWVLVAVLSPNELCGYVTSALWVSVEVNYKFSMLLLAIKSDSLGNWLHNKERISHNPELSLL